MTDPAPAVSVVIAYYNGATVIGEQLESLAAQVDAPPFEVLLMDNISPDDACAAAAPFQERLDLRVIPARNAQGQGYARNLGILHAHAEHVAICDQDDRVGERWVRAHHDQLAAESCLSSGPMEFRTLNPPVTGQMGHDLGSQPPFAVAGYLPFVFGSNTGIRRADAIALGGFDNSYRGGDEDVDFSWRAQEAGLPMRVSDGAVVHYRVRTTPRAVFRQQIGYGMTPVLTYVRSRGRRPLDGMSFKWTVGQTALLPLRWLHARRDPTSHLEFAQEAGRIVGNLKGQWQYRARKRIPAPELMPSMPEYATLVSGHA